MESHTEKVKVLEKNRIAGTEEPKGQQDKISGTTTAHREAGEETGAIASSGEGLRRQGSPGTRNPTAWTTPGRGSATTRREGAGPRRTKKRSSFGP